MQEITSITSNINQKMTIVLENNETVEFHIYYKKRVQCWFFDFIYKKLECYGNKVVLHPNILRQFRNLIPFGFMFSGESLVQPFKQDDFSSGRISFYVLNSEDVKQVEREIFND